MCDLATLWGRWDFLPDSHDQPMWWLATGLVLRNSDLTLMFGGNRDMAAKVLENVIRVLGARLENTNSLVAAQGRTIRDLERRLQEYEPLDSSDGDDHPGVDVDDDDEYEDDEEWDDENDE